MRLIVMYAIALHSVWAVGLWLDASAAAATGPSNLSYWFASPTLTALALVFASGCASRALWNAARHRRAVAWLIPQQAILYMSAYGAVMAMVAGHFADGVERPHWFIIVDQMPALLAPALHSVALILIGKQR